MRARMCNRFTRIEPFRTRICGTITLDSSFRRSRGSSPCFVQSSVFLKSLEVETTLPVRDIRIRQVLDKTQKVVCAQASAAYLQSQTPYIVVSYLHVFAR